MTCKRTLAFGKVLDIAEGHEASTALDVKLLPPRLDVALTLRAASTRHCSGDGAG
jgi:hypothetical protein